MKKDWLAPNINQGIIMFPLALDIFLATKYGLEGGGRLGFLRWLQANLGTEIEAIHTDSLKIFRDCSMIILIPAR